MAKLKETVLSFKLTTLLDIAQQKGIKKIILDVVQTQTIALKLYTKFGFSETARLTEPGPEKQMFHTIYMEKHLSS